MNRFACLCLCLLAVSSYADIPSDGSNTFTSDTKQYVNVSTTAASPTQIMTVDNYITRGYVVNWSTNTLYISSATPMNTSTAYAIQPSATAGQPNMVPFTLDGPQIPYWGSLYAVLGGTSTAANGNTVAVIRLK